MSFCDIRITTEEIGNIGRELDALGAVDLYKHRRLITIIKADLLRKYEVENMVIGEEKTNKFGEQTKIHYHINFYCDDEIKKDTIQKWFRTAHNVKGNSQYSIRVQPELKDHYRWWRYPIKEKTFWIKNPEMFQQFGVTYEEAKRQAVDERNRQIEMNLKTRQSLMDKNAFRDKMFRSLKEEYQETSVTDKKIWCDIGSYYIRHSKTPAFGKLDDMVIDFKVSTGLVTIEEVYEFRHNS